MCVSLRTLTCGQPCMYEQRVSVVWREKVSSQKGANFLCTHFIEITKDVYSNSSYQVKTQEGLTNPIIRGKGVIQDCPWSVIVFEQGIYKWLRWIESEYPPLHRPNPVQGYVDDVGMMAIEDKKFEYMATKTTGFLDYSGMDAKPRKCAVSCMCIWVMTVTYQTQPIICNVLDL